MMLPVRWTGRERGSQRIAPKASTFCITRPHGPFRSSQLAPKRPDNSTRLSQNSQRHYPDEVFGIRDKPIAPGSPWQNGFVERLIGSIRRECVDHVVAFGEAHLPRILTTYADHYNELRPEVRLRASAKGEGLDKIFPAPPQPVQTSAIARIARGNSVGQHV